MPDDSAPWPLFGISQRLPPSNLQAEEALLGALLANNKGSERCARLRPEHFSNPVNARTFAEIRRRIDGGALVDAVSLKDFACSTSGAGGEGQAYLGHLLASFVGIINVTEYADSIRRDAVKRELIDVAERLSNGCFDDVEPGRLWSELSGLGDAAVRDGTAESAAVSLDAAMDAALAAMDRARAGTVSGISTGFQRVDERLGGLEPGLVYVIAGRPGMGKSAWGHQVAVNVARSGVVVLELSLEMSALQLGMRTLAAAAGVPIVALKAGRANVEDADRIVRARYELTGLPLTIDDSAGQTPSQIAAKARAARRKSGLGLVMVDHLNLMRAEDADARHGGTWATERASGSMLQLAKDCECPVLLLAQLNRGVEGREDKRPGLSDLRQAGAIEQDAYAVGFIYREDYYLQGEPEHQEGDTQEKTAKRVADWRDRKAKCAGRAELLWRKVRDGEPGVDQLTFHGPTATFGEPTPP